MGNRLQIDTTALRDLGTNLRTIAEEFTYADERSEELARAICHDDLASAVREFADNWDDRRVEIVEEIASLADASTGVGEEFEALDADFASALRGETA
ncbi:hypothetical protein [Paraoerskovia marina]|uniref:Excreted virulence factor EspC, type VII ESX diderm n=1 Tax=Paraoerskovia marina TaxID=545619 RepID=A0A1H1NI33_9CELL|nr:hypothetical protein [Paraoerskovia marina]SDR98573.1 hypothetical protein SAMN04489860_0539 [Paraoerskovia marina]